MNARTIEVNLSQGKIKSINSAFQKELDYWKEAALKNLDENEANQLKVLAPLSFLLIRKAEKNAKKVDINKMIAYLKSEYSTNIRNQIVLFQNFPSLEEVSSSEGIQEELKLISKGNKALFEDFIWQMDSSRKDGIQAR